MKRGPMDASGFYKVGRNYAKLQKILEPNDIIGLLITLDVIDDDDRDLIISTQPPTKKTRVEVLIGIMKSRGDEAYPKFIKALEKAKYDGLIADLEATPLKDVFVKERTQSDGKLISSAVHESVKRGPMDASGSYKVDHNYDKLQKILEPNDIIGLLITLDVIDDDDRDLIISTQPPTKKTRVEVLIGIMKSRGDEAYPKFIKALEKAKYDGLIADLEATPLKDVFVKERTQSDGQRSIIRKSLSSTSVSQEDMDGEEQAQTLYVRCEGLSESKLCDANVCSKEKSDDTNDNSTSETLTKRRKKTILTDSSREELDIATSESIMGNVEGENDTEIDASNSNAEVSPNNANFILREYQRQLAKPGIDGKNCVVCSPTGSGKTVVAFEIIKEHLRKKSTKVAFLANQVHLAKQHHENFKKFPFDSTLVTGETRDKLKEAFSKTVERNQVLFLTPQILIDEMKQGEVKNVGVFSLIVFDECHHTHGDTPFKKIMLEYMKMKFSGDCPRTALPQILGLTASLGVGNSHTLSGAESHIKDILINLDVEEIAVPDEKSDLSSHINKPSEAISETKPRENDPFKDIVRDIMLKVEDKIAKYKDPDEKPTAQFHRLLNAPALKGGPEYTEWVNNLEQKAKVLNSLETKQFYMSCCGHLKIYNLALALNEDCRSSDAVDFLSQQITRYTGKNDTDQMLMELFEGEKEKLAAIDDKQCKNPKLDKMRQRIEHEAAQNSEFGDSPYKLQAYC